MIFLTTAIERVYYYEINIFSMFVLSLIYLNNHRQSNKLNINYFKELIIALFVACLADTVILGVQNTQGIFAHWVMNFFSFVYFSATVCCTLYALLYVFHLNGRKLRRWIIALMCLPALAVMIVAFYSMFGGSIFYITNDNVYTRGNLFMLQLIISFLYLLTGIIISFCNLVKKVSAQEKFLELSKIYLLSVPVIAAILQTYVFGSVLLMPMTTFALLLMYVVTINGEFNYDLLTRIFRKKVFESNAKRIVKRYCSALIVIDIDNFKSVNDLYGHRQGDLLLATIANNLKEIFCRNAVVGRIGGDEFAVIVYKYRSLEEIENKCSVILKLTNSFMSTIAKLHFSVSIGISYNQKGCDYDNAYQDADKALYLAKKSGRDCFRIYSPENMLKADLKHNIALVVDDDELSRIILCSFLESYCTTVELRNGEEALQYIRKNKEQIGVIFLDLLMPVMDGYQLIMKLKEENIFNDLHIVIISVNDIDFDQAEYLGVAEAVHKPFDPLDIKCLINKYISLDWKKK